MFDIPLRNLNDSWFFLKHPSQTIFVCSRLFSQFMLYCFISWRNRVNSSWSYCHCWISFKETSVFVRTEIASPQCGHDDYLAFWHRCDRIMFYRISGAALYIFGEDGFSVPLSQRSFFFQFFRGFEMLLVLHNRLRHVNRWVFSMRIISRVLVIIP